MSYNAVIRVADKASEPELNAARVLSKEVDRRTGVQMRINVGAGSSPKVTLGTPDSLRGDSIIEGIRLDDLGPEGFVVAPAGKGTVAIANTPAAVLFAAGRLLRNSSLEQGRWDPPTEEIRGRPQLSVRNIYFAGHMGNWYSHAPPDELRDYLDDMALWGYNELTTVLEVKAGETFEDAWARLSSLEDHARSLGMKVGRIAQSNTSFVKPPDEFRATPGSIPGAFDVCPSEPGALEFLVEDKRQFFEVMQPFDFMTLWPYDGGGCYSESCAPWARTFLRLSEAIAKQAVGVAGEVRVSAWWFEHDVAGEDDALFEYLDSKPDWFRFVVAGFTEASRWRRDRRILPDNYRVLLFPEISMFDGIPWGGRGANPAPRKFATELSEVREMLEGAVVYSEGRYEDVNKFLWAQLLWSPDRDFADILREYCRFYFGAASELEATDLLVGIEKGMEGLPDSERWRRGQFHRDWDEQSALIEPRLTPYGRDSWRWRLVRAKTGIEALVSALHEGSVTPRKREELLKKLKENYELLQFQLNLHDPKRSLPTWIYAPLGEAFPPDVIGESITS